MPNVYMNEVERVQTIGPNGIGVYPPVPVEDVQKLSNTGREMKEVTPKANRIPNPIAADEGAIMKNKDASWQEGKDEDSLPDPATVTDGMVVMASGGKWIAADVPATTTDHPVMVAIGTSDGTTVTLDKTWQEIHDADGAGKLVLVTCKDYNNKLLAYVLYTGIDSESDEYYVDMATTDGNGTSVDFVASSANGYPAFALPPGGVDHPVA